MRRAAVLLVAVLLLTAGGDVREEPGTKLLDEKVDGGALTLRLIETKGQAGLSGKFRTDAHTTRMTYVLGGLGALFHERKTRTVQAGGAIWQGDTEKLPFYLERGSDAIGRALVLDVPRGDRKDIAVRYRADTATEYPILGGKGKARIILDKDEGTDGSISVGRLTIVKGAEVPEHVHDGSAEILYVVSGAGTMTLAGKPVVVEKGKAYFIPANTKHSFTATDDVDAVQFYVPGGPEQRFKVKPKADQK